MGIAPREALEACRARAGSFSAADVARVEEIEKVTQHDVIAFLTLMEERIGPSARWLHWGMTSSDVVDTALALTLRDAADLLIDGVEVLREAVKRQAFAHKRTRIVGRTHGIHAEPTTFGLKLAIWYDELGRSSLRLRNARRCIAVGKLSGAVGTFAHLPPRVEALAMDALGLLAAPASNQIIQRDRHAEFFTAIALVGSSVEKFATEIRHLQRTEVREVQEPFGKGQRGSSAMPHKRNPVLSENVSGLARLLRGYALAAMESVALWHERDISHSSVERVIGPDATIVCDFMLHRFAGVIGGLIVDPARMASNLGALGGIVHSQRILLELARRGMERQQAYSVVQRSAMRYLDKGTSFQDALADDPQLATVISPAEISEIFRSGGELEHVDSIFERVFGQV